MATINNRKLGETKLRIGEVRFFYSYLLEMRKDENGEPDKYSVQIVFPKENKEAVKLIEAACETAVQKGIAKKFNGKRPPAAKLHMPLRDGDEEYPDKPEYAGMWFFNASNKVRPLVTMAGADDPKESVRVESEEEFYSGCYGDAVVEFFAYNVSGNAGVSASIVGVKKRRDGDRLSGSSASVSDFEDDDGEDWMN